jgi:hypothetical protein
MSTTLMRDAKVVRDGVLSRDCYEPTYMTDCAIDTERRLYAFVPWSVY